MAEKFEIKTMSKFFLYTALIIIALAASNIMSLKSHKTVEFHTGQAVSFETYGGEDGGG